MKGTLNQRRTFAYRPSATLCATLFAIQAHAQPSAGADLDTRPPEPADCAALVKQAREQSANAVMHHLRKCDIETARLVDGIREIEEIRTAEPVPAEGFNPVAALATIKEVLAGGPDNPPGNATALAEAQRRITELETQIARLAAETGETQPTPAAAPLLSTEQLENRIAQLLHSGDASAVDITAPARLIDVIRSLDKLRTGQRLPTEPFDPAAALTAIEKALTDAEPTTGTPDVAVPATAPAPGTPPIAAPSPGTPPTAAPAPGTPPVAPPLLAPEQLKALVAKLLRPGECDEIDIGVAENGSVTVTGYAATEADRNALRRGFATVLEQIPDSRFDVGVRWGGSCTTALGGPWSAMPDSRGGIRRVGFGDAVTTLADSLPTPEQCEELSIHLADHAQLGQYFARGQNPLVWCRSDTEPGAEIGVCKREAYSERWDFLRSWENYTAFPIIHAGEEG